MPHQHRAAASGQFCIGYLPLAAGHDPCLPEEGVGDGPGEGQRKTGKGYERNVSGIVAVVKVNTQTGIPFLSPKSRSSIFIRLTT